MDKVEYSNVVTEIIHRATFEDGTCYEIERCKVNIKAGKNYCYALLYTDPQGNGRVQIDKYKTRKLAEQEMEKRIDSYLLHRPAEQASTLR